MKLHYGEVWPDLKKLFNDAKSRRIISAYFTGMDGARLKKSDVLICDASDATINSAGTDRVALKAAHKRGVKLFSVAGLNANVFLVDNDEHRPCRKLRGGQIPQRSLGAALLGRPLRPRRDEGVAAG